LVRQAWFVSWAWCAWSGAVACASDCHAGSEHRVAGRRDQFVYLHRDPVSRLNPRGAGNDTVQAMVYALPRFYDSACAIDLIRRGW
jgi:hypothetical protein